MMEQYILNTHLDSMKPRSHVSKPKPKGWIYAECRWTIPVLQLQWVRNTPLGCYPGSKGPWGWDCLGQSVPPAPAPKDTHRHCSAGRRPEELNSIEKTALFCRLMNSRAEHKCVTCFLPIHHLHHFDIDLEKEIYVERFNPGLSSTATHGTGRYT